MNMFLILFTLIAIFLIDSTLGKAFDSQCTTTKTFSKKTHEECNVQRKCYGVSKLTFPQFLWNQKQKTVSLSSIALSQSQMTIILLLWAAFCPNWQITIHCFFYKQLSVPIDNSANFKFLPLSRPIECNKYRYWTQDSQWLATNHFE